MGAKAEDLARVVEFRERLVAFANDVNANVHRYEETPQRVMSHVGEEQSWLSQAYGRIYAVVGRYGLAQMIQFGRIVSQDVARDTIQAPMHPGYADLAQMAVGHVDQIIGQLRAEVEDQATKTATSNDIYRLTSIAYWLGRLVALIRWLVTTQMGRIVALIGATVGIVIGGIASGAARAVVDRILGS